jgi:hypothetical protein
MLKYSRSFKLGEIKLFLKNKGYRFIKLYPLIKEYYTKPDNVQSVLIQLEKGRYELEELAIQSDVEKNIIRSYIANLCNRINTIIPTMNGKRDYSIVNDPINIVNVNCSGTFIVRISFAWIEEEFVENYLKPRGINYVFLDLIDNLVNKAINE